MEFSFAGEDIYSRDSDDDFVHDKSLGASLLEELNTLTFFEDDSFQKSTKKSPIRRQPGVATLDDSDSSSDILENFCHSSNIDDWITQLKKRKVLAFREVEKLCTKAKEVLSKESNVVELSSPITVCGDIHGQHYDLLELFKIAGEPPDVNYLFLGDYVDRGRYSVAVVSLLLALKIKYPKRITLLRGNHESRQTTQVYGFYDECLALYGNSFAWTLFMGTFDYLPLCALVDNMHLCMHGGLSPSFVTIDQIRTLLRFGEIPHEGPVCDIVWSDPADKKDALGFQNSARGAGCTWGKDVSAHFTATNDIETVIRAHQLVNKGIDWCHNDKVVTVFSAPNYCYRSGNLAGYIMMDGQESTAYTFEAAPRHNFPHPPRFGSFKSFFF